MELWKLMIRVNHGHCLNTPNLLFEEVNCINDKNIKWINNLAYFFRQNHHNEIWDEHGNDVIKKNYLFVFRRLQNNVTCSFCKKYFYKQHQGKS